MLRFTPGTGGLKNCKKPIITQKMKIIVWGCLIAQIKRLDALVTMQNNLNSLQCTVAKKNFKKN